MLKKDEHALICDFAETYHIYDLRRLPASLAASLAVGLRDDSRIKMKMSGLRVSAEILMLAAIVDRLSILIWAQTKDAEKGKNRPKSITDMFFEKEKDVNAFSSGEDFDKERNRLLEKAERVALHGN